MGGGSKAGEWVFKGFTAALGLTTIYITANFSFNLYRGISWHNAQSKMNKEEQNGQESSAGDL